MTWLSNLKIRYKFMFFSGLILLFLLTLSGVGVWGTSRILSIVNDLNSDQIPELTEISQANTALEAAESQLHLAFMQTDPALIANPLAKTREKMGIVQERLNKYINNPHPADEAGIVKSVRDGLIRWTSDMDNLIELAQLNTPQAKQEAVDMENVEDNGELTEVLNKIININSKESQDIASQTFFTVVVADIVVSLIIIAISLSTVFVLARTLNNPLLKLRKAMTALATGDLSQQVEIVQKDEVGELGQTYNITLGSLRSLVLQLHAHSQQVSAATSELSVQARNQVTGSNQQASAITEITQALQELNQTAENIAQQATKVAIASENSLRQAHQVSQVADKMAQSQELGRANVAQTINTLFQLKGQVEAIAEQQRELQQQSSVIQQVIGIIDNISHETHLLALNAAIEAAGAGEFGDRFAVIAAEVKRLATNSVDATKDVRKSLMGIAQVVEHSSQIASEGVRQAEKATLEANQSDTTLLSLNELSEQVKIAARQIVFQIEQTAFLANGIGVATQQQQIASQQVLQTMISIEAVTAQNLSSIQQGDIATQQLSTAARELEHSANVFKLSAA